MRVATWNVLHRIHAENWEEPAILAHPDEPRRVTAIAERIATVLLPDCAVIGLQEVSGDQLAALRQTLPASVQLLTSAYPRIPRPRSTALQLDEPTEYLATIVPAGGARLVASAAFPTDGGKGYLAIELAGIVVINTHVSYGERRDAQLAELAAFAHGRPGTVAMLGDFNAERATIVGALPGFVAAELPAGSLPTRPRQDASSKSQDIDHVLALRGHASDARVVSAEGLSDHNLVVARVTP